MHIANIKSWEKVVYFSYLNKTSKWNPRVIRTLITICTSNLLVWWTSYFFLWQMVNYKNHNSSEQFIDKIDQKQSNVSKSFFFFSSSSTSSRLCMENERRAYWAMVSFSYLLIEIYSKSHIKIKRKTRDGKQCPSQVDSIFQVSFDQCFCD